MPRYDASFSPPAPLMDVTVVHPTDASKSTRLRGKLDTGADLSAIPESLMTQFNLLARGTVTSRDYKGEATTHAAYSVSLEIASVRLDNIKVVATPRANVLLGRNVLNKFIITLDGKALTFEMQDP
jgi:predicted aspartyl protease